MVETDLGKATILYEDPNEGTIEETVDNEHIAYFQDHWIIKTGEHEEGQDIIRRIPAQRVYFVERNVEEFEEEVGTVLHEFQSLADDIGLGVRSLRDRVEAVTSDFQKDLLGSEQTERTERPERTDTDTDAIRIDIEEEEPDKSDVSNAGADESPDRDERD